MKQRQSRSYVSLVLLLALGLVTSISIWACSGDESALTSPENSLQTFANRDEVLAAVQTHNRHIPDILNTPKVAGTAVGADEHGKPVIHIYTEEHLPPGKLPASLDGYRVVQNVTGPIRPYKGPPPMDGGGNEDPQALQTPPVKMGTSGGWRYDLANGYCCAGTLGSLIQIGGSKYILSNYHVLYADTTPGGNGITAQAGDPVIQPGLIDVGCIANNAQNVGTLVNNGGSLPDGNPNGAVGCRIALINGSVDASGAILNVGVPAGGNGLAASVGLNVKKMGRTTGLTRSSVSAINGAFSITYSDECAGGADFTQSYTNQIVIQNRRCKFQDGGDSGSLLLEDVDNSPRAVGLCFAGSVQCSNQAIAIANPIGDVLSHYGASMVGN